MAVSFWRELAAGYREMLEAPWVYLAMALFVLVQYRRIQAIERASFGVRVTEIIREWGVSLGLGAVAGLFASACLIGLGVEFGRPDAFWLWGTLLVLAVIDVRLACLAYAASILVLLQWIVDHVAYGELARTGDWLAGLRGLHARALLLSVGLLHVAEGALAYFAGARQASPLFLRSRRGQAVGAYTLQKFWPVPLFVPFAGGGIAPFPALIGFSGVVMASLPRQAAREGGAALMAYGALTFAFALAALWRPWVVLAVALFAAAGHALVYGALRRHQTEATPFFVRPAHGVRVLAVLPGGPAATAGVVPGDVIVRIGGLTVNSPYDIHFAVDQNPAYAKLEIVDGRGETRFAGTPIYADAPRQLGVVAVPAERAVEYAGVQTLGVGRWLWRWWWRRRRTVVR